MSVFAKIGCDDGYSLDPSDYESVIRDISLVNKTLTIEGSEWNNTLIDGCNIVDSPGSAIEIRNVKNFAITNCRISGANETGIRIRSSGSTDNVRIVNNVIKNVGGDGISAAKRVKDGVDHIGLIISGNKFVDTGIHGRSGRTHGIYTQASDAVIFDNEVSGSRDGNAISIRSSGLVSCNRISGTSQRRKPGIRYFADNYTGPTRLLIITNNEIRDSSPAVDLRKPDGWTKRKPEALVTRFIITGNNANFSPMVEVAKFWMRNEDVSLEIERNTILK